MSVRDRIATAEGKRRVVRAIFATIADRYDFITVLLSYGQDRRWKRRLVDLAAVRPGARALDLATGTGLLLRRHDASEPVDPQALALLRGVPLLGWLPSVGLERLASKLAPLDIPAGDVLLREGDPDDRAYVIERGEVLVTVAGHEIVRLGPGDLVGEIALLRSVPRTPTVTAVTDLRVLALDRSEFLVAATGAPDARRAADVLIVERLGQHPVT